MTAAEIRRLSADATEHSIIIFRNQFPNLPARGRTAVARASAAGAAQAGVRAELAQVHATHVRSFQIINAISATISSAEVKRLRAIPQSGCGPRRVPPVRVFGSGPGPALPALGSGDPSTATQQICPSNPAQPLIEPEARTVMNVAAAQQLADGTGVKVGIIADGIDRTTRT